LKSTKNEVVPELRDAMTVDGALMQIPYEFKLGTCEGLRQYFDGHGISLEDAETVTLRLHEANIPGGMEREKHYNKSVSSVKHLLCGSIK